MYLSEAYRIIYTASVFYNDIHQMCFPQTSILKTQIHFKIILEFLNITNDKVLLFFSKTPDMFLMSSHV